MSEKYEIQFLMFLGPKLISNKINILQSRPLTKATFPQTLATQLSDMVHHYFIILLFTASAPKTKYINIKAQFHAFRLQSNKFRGNNSNFSREKGRRGRPYSPARTLSLS